MGAQQARIGCFGHVHGVESVRNIVEGCAELGIGYLTLYAFSTENWDRPGMKWLAMELLVNTIGTKPKPCTKQYQASRHR